MGDNYLENLNLLFKLDHAVFPADGQRDIMHVEQDVLAVSGLSSGL